MEITGVIAMSIILLLVGIAESESKSFLINCGTNLSVELEGRTWIGDLDPNSNLTLNYQGISVPIPAITESSIYNTARIFTENLNYTFKSTRGKQFLRLHFYPFSFDTYNANGSSFGAKANGLKLVSEFNVPTEISHRNSNSSSLIKEYILGIDSDFLVIEFIPTKGSFGFVNAIEIIPVEEELFSDTVSKVGGNNENTFLNFSERGIETMYRLNVGGPEIKPNKDFDLYRMWESDSSYMLTSNAGSGINNSSNISYSSVNDTSVAPLLVYETARTMSNNEVLEKRFNMSWKFDVDPDFDYLLRLHFCELMYGKANQRIFRIYINNRTAVDNFDTFVRAGGMNKAYHQDFLDVISSKISTVWIQLGPDTAAGASGTDALLNGLEIFKLSRNGNLAHQRDSLNGNPANGTSSKNGVLWLEIGVGIASVLIIIILFTAVFYFYKNRRIKKSAGKHNSPLWRPLFLLNTTANAKGFKTQNPNGSVGPARVGKRFSLAEIRLATNNFDEKLLTGEGGFGKVYKGEIDDQGTLAAIKRAHPQSDQGLAEFETEIEMLSKLRHRHLVSMIGFCEEQNEMILIYEYMANGTLRSHLFGTDLSPLDWKQRLEICIGAARGLHYLHTGAERGIIHRDVKTTNILLDENFVAKMADFGLSKTGPPLEHTHVSTAVKGSFGYLDPEYFRRQQLTEKSDVYSFGVVLFEVICARAVINPALPKDQINLAEWAMRWQKERSLETIVDPRLEGIYSLDLLRKYGEIAEKCLADEGKNRPTMGEVLWHLEYVLQLHEAWVHAKAGEKHRQGSGLNDLNRAVEVIE